MRVRVYTDGACSGNPGPGGWAVAFMGTQDVMKSSGYEVDTTNNRMELTAVIEGLRQILEGEANVDGHVSAIDIYSDSAYVVNAINNDWLSSWKRKMWTTQKGEPVKNRDLWEHWLSLVALARKRRIKVSLLKVKGHNGNTFNELVDRMAVEARMMAQHEAMERDAWR